MIITITGPSGSGKSSIARRLTEELTNCRMLTSYTTRPPRKMEIVDEYKYLSEEDFERMRDQGGFEWTTPPLRGKNYGTTKESLDEAVAHPDTIWVMILVPERVTTLYEAMTKREAADLVRSFFICSPDGELLKKRLIERGFSPEQAASDVTRCQTWEAQVRGSGVPVTYIEDNDDLDEKYRRVIERIS